MTSPFVAHIENARGEALRAVSVTIEDAALMRSPEAVNRAVNCARHLLSVLLDAREELPQYQAEKAASRVSVVLLETSNNPSDPFCKTTSTSIVGIYADRSAAEARAQSLTLTEPLGLVSVTIEDRLVA